MSKDSLNFCEEGCSNPQSNCLIKQNMLPEDTVYNLAEMFKVLSEPTRIRILHALSRQELCVCNLADILGMNQSAISHQLRILRNARLVKFRKEGKEVWYSLDDDHVITLMCQSVEHISHGDYK